MKRADQILAGDMDLVPSAQVPVVGEPEPGTLTLQQLCREFQISRRTYYLRRAWYAQFRVSDGGGLKFSRARVRQHLAGLATAPERRVFGRKLQLAHRSASSQPAPGTAYQRSKRTAQTAGEASDVIAAPIGFGSERR
jgi:hypothetical protein